MRNLSMPPWLSRLPSGTICGSRGGDRWVAPALGLLAAAAALLLLLVIAFLFIEAWPVLTTQTTDSDTFGWQLFFRSDGWYPLEGKFGALPMLWASLAAAVGAMAIAAPLGIGSAVFLQFYAPATLARPFSMMIALLAGIPSVVFGLWGLTVLVPLIGTWRPPGASLLSAILILALMILPTVALTSRSALAAVPDALLRGASALGMTRKGLVLGVAIPAARGGIVGGLLLAVARALGETMAVLMVAGNIVQTPTSLFDPVRVLTANIALEMAYATGAHRAALFASGLLLMALVLALAWWAARWRTAHG